MPNPLIVSAPPYIRTGETNHCLMFDVYIAAIPAILAGLYFFGPRTILVLFLCIFSAMVTEAVIQMLKAPGYRFRPFFYNLLTDERVTLADGSALITGLLLAFNLSPSVPFYIPIVGSSVAITLGKHVFGGLGYNIFNPALFARAFLLAAWPAQMTSWTAPYKWGMWWDQLSLAPGTWTLDAVSTATPLGAMKEQGVMTPYFDLIVGNIGGCIGETSAIALLIGGAYLLYKGTITWHVPGCYLATVAVMAAVFGKDPFFHLFSGGLMLGAFFMATDVVTSPLSKPARVLFGIGCGVVTMLIRMFGAFPEGVTYSILLMNACTPLLDRYTVSKGLRVKRIVRTP